MSTTRITLSVSTLGSVISALVDGTPPLAWCPDEQGTRMRMHQAAFRDPAGSKQASTAQAACRMLMLTDWLYSPTCLPRLSLS